jgi:hypothetical protein
MFNNKSKEDLLIKTIEKYVVRIKELKQYCVQNTILANIKDISIVKLLALRQDDHWQFIEEQVKEALNTRDYDHVFTMIEIALDHLKAKTQWKLSDANSSPAFSNSAVLSDFGSHIPVIGIFFSSLSQNAHLIGVSKTADRLEQIDEWLDILEEHFSPNPIDRIIRLL